MAVKKRKAKAEVACPFCGEAEELYVDPSAGEHQTYTEDCSVCCRPRIVHISPGDFPGEVTVRLEREE